MLQKMYLILLSSLLAVASCAQPDKEPITKTKFVEKNVPIVSRPTPVTLLHPKFYVVTKDNYEDFIAEFRTKNATETFVAISVKDYEKLALNLGELKRYIEQQDEIIVYYENSVR